MNPQRPHSERLDDATAERLARLSRREMDVTELENKLDIALSGAGSSEVGQPDEAPFHAAPIPPRFSIRNWLRPVAGVAAVLALALTLVFVLSSNTPRADAAVLELSQLHRDLVSGQIELHTVTSAAQANHWIASQQASVPALPERYAGASVKSCCLADVQGQLVAVAQVEDAGENVTLVVAKATHFAMEMGTVFEIDGQKYFGHELNGIHMMMANRGDRWLCVMGDRSYEELARLASDIEF